MSLRFADNDTAHDDLILQFGGESWVCDSNHLGLYRELLPGQEDAGKVRAVQRQFLGQWLTSVEQLPDGGTAYLPYDFSDQYTGWLACRRSGD